MDSTTLMKATKLEDLTDKDCYCEDTGDYCDRCKAAHALNEAYSLIDDAYRNLIDR